MKLFSNLEFFENFYFQQFSKLGLVGSVADGEKIKKFLSSIPLPVYLVLGTGLTGYLYLQYKWSYFKRRGIPGPPPSMKQFGNTNEILKIMGRDEKSINQLDNWVKKYGKVFGLYMGTKPALVILDPEVLKEVWYDSFYMTHQ